MAKSYSKSRSLVTVVFIDGEVGEYEISAGHKVGAYLAEAAGTTGILHLMDADNDRCHSIPTANIREWTIQTLSTEGQPDAY